jgi:hypothetical protein
MDWPVRTTILIDVHVPLPPLAYRGVLTEETDE